MDNGIPVVVRLRVESQPMEGYEPGKCPECGAPIQMHLKRTQQRQ